MLNLDESTKDLLLSFLLYLSASDVHGQLSSWASMSFAFGTVLGSTYPVSSGVWHSPSALRVHGGKSCFGTRKVAILLGFLFDLLRKIDRSHSLQRAYRGQVYPPNDCGFGDAE
jgi:hypothetical protein